MAPLSLVSTAWAMDAEALDPTMRISMAEAKNREDAFYTDADLYVTNFDAWTWLVKQKPQFFNRFDWFLIDEATAIKNPTAKRTKAITQIAKRFEHRAILSGSLGAKSILDFWAPTFLLDSGKRLGPMYSQYRSAVCAPIQRGAARGAIEWVDKPGSFDAVMAQLADISIRHELTKCVDMPEHVIVPMTIKLPAKLMMLYRQMAKDMILAMKGKQITAVNAAVLHGKLRQMATGSLYDNDSVSTVLDNSRTLLAMDMVEDRPRGTIIFFKWQHQKEQLILEAQRRGLTFGVIDGHSGSGAVRKQLVHDYQAGMYDVLFLQEQAAAHGLTLTYGTTTLWMSPTSVYDTFKQGNHRQFRNGQTRRCEVIVLVGQGTVDEGSFEICLGRKSNMDLMYEIFSQYQ